MAGSRGLWHVCGSLALLALSSCANFRNLSADLAALESTSSITGRADVSGWSGKPVIVLALQETKHPTDPIPVRDAFNDRRPGTYTFRLAPGRYWIGAFEDQNEDGKFQDGERAAIAGPLEVVAGKKIKGPTLVVTKPFVRSRELAAREKISTYPFAVGEVMPLNDPHFGPESGRKGLWKPVSFLMEDRPGIYFLQPFDPDRTPVLFVHGMSGYPQEFRTLIERLDPARFQPWIAYYPSGYELATLGRMMEMLVSRLEQEKHLERLCVVAHSMGGLVARRFLLDYQETSPENAVRTLVTIASPFAGMPSASWGVRMAPEVVPAWFDIAPESKFLDTLFESKLSGRVEYHLLFAFDDSGSGDSVVPLLSQLRVEAQGDAELVRGYGATHTGALRSDAVAAQVLRALDRCAGDTNGSMAAPRPREPAVVE